MSLVIRSLDRSDADVLSAAFSAVAWPKPVSLFRRYLKEQEEGSRLVFVAEWQRRPAGYVTLHWISDYGPFAERGIPEVGDFNVLPAFRRQGIGGAMLDTVEAAAATRSPLVGLGVGLYADYGAAQRLYVRRGYLPDGRGIMYGNQPVKPGSSIVIDDEMTLMFTRELRPPVD